MRPPRRAEMQGTFMKKQSSLLHIALFLLIPTWPCYGAARCQPEVEAEPAPNIEDDTGKLRKFWGIYYVGEALRQVGPKSAIATAVHHGLQLDNSDNNNNDDEPDRDLAEPRLRLSPADAAAVFDRLVYDAAFNFDDGARQRLDTVLRQRISFVDRMCGLSQEQKEKLRLAGTGDIERLFDRIASHRQEFVALTAGESDDVALAAVIRETTTLRNPLNSGPLQENSLFANVLRNCLTAEQTNKYSARRSRLSAALKKTVPEVAIVR